MASKKKTDSDKDLLYSKLLPALNENPFSASSLQDPWENTPVDTGEEDSLSALRSRLFARDQSRITNSYVTINVMESVVLKYIDQVIRRFNTCSCDRCKCDIAAYALSHLSAKYVVTDAEGVAQLEEEVETKAVMDALVNAVIHIRSNPRH